MSITFTTSLSHVLPTVLLAALLAPLTSSGQPAASASATAPSTAPATAPSTAPAATPFDTWAESIAVQRMRADPVQSTYRQYLPAAEQQLLDAQLTPNTAAYRAARLAAAKTALAQLAAMDRSKMAAPQRTSADIVEWSLRSTVAAEPFADFEFVFSQTRGLHVSMVNFLSQSHPIRNAADIDHYLSRLDQVAEQIDNGVAGAKDSASRGFLMPRFITQAALGQFARFLADAPAHNVFVTSLDARIAALGTVSAEDRTRAVARAEKITAQAVIPAYARAEALLKAQLPLTTDDAGLWRLPGGDKAYADALRRYTTTDFTAAEIHALGLREVARIEAKMDVLLRQLGYAEGSVNSRYAKLEVDSQPKADPEVARAQLLARHAAVLRDAQERSKLLFDITPKAPVEVRREPLLTEKTAAAHYTSPAKDGSLPGIFWAPMPGPLLRITSMRSLTYHEGVPGHHFQIALQQETESLPRYRRDGVFSGGSAFSEGWALYAEQLAAESGWYEGDVQGQLGQLDSELFRARRLVVDTGLHTMKWTRQQAIDYGISPQEVDRYVVNPGQACAYKIGMLHILDLRAKAQKTLGDSFSLKAFHNLVLQTGNVPLAVLTQVVNDWVAGQRKA